MWYAAHHAAAAAGAASACVTGIVSRCLLQIISMKAEVNLEEVLPMLLALLPLQVRVHVLLAVARFSCGCDGSAAHRALFLRPV